MTIKNSCFVLLATALTISIALLYGMDRTERAQYFKDEENRILDQRVKCDKAIKCFVENKVAKALRIKESNGKKTKA